MRKVVALFPNFDWLRDDARVDGQSLTCHAKLKAEDDWLGDDVWNFPPPAQVSIISTENKRYENTADQAANFGRMYHRGRAYVVVGSHVPTWVFKPLNISDMFRRRSWSHTHTEINRKAGFAQFWDNLSNY